jgi:hypothetical protein
MFREFSNMLSLLRLRGLVFNEFVAYIGDLVFTDLYLGVVT